MEKEEEEERRKKVTESSRKVHTNCCTAKGDMRR
jgi:hypothetical protein